MNSQIKNRVAVLFSFLILNLKVNSQIKNRVAVLFSFFCLVFFSRINIESGEPEMVFQALADAFEKPNNKKT